MMISEQLYVKNRTTDFSKIKSGLSDFLDYEIKDALLFGGDSKELLKKIPDHTISLILTDPPYHTTKKKNITNDTAFNTDDDFLSWIQDYANEWRRILRPNGSIFIFCSSTMSARIEVQLSKTFNVLSHVVWTKPNDPGFDGWKQKMRKESLRQWYDHSERIIFAEPATEGNIFRSWFGNFLRSLRQECSLTCKDVTEITGDYGKVNHGGAVSNWEAGRNIPSRDQYTRLCNAFLLTGKVKRMPVYENVIRAFEVNSSVEFTDVWNFNSVKPYPGKHPAEKPIDMLEHCIKSTTYEGDIVLDCFAGSGSTAIAALNTKRKIVALELEATWINTIRDRLEHYQDPVKHGLNTKKNNIMRITNQPKINGAQIQFNY